MLSSYQFFNFLIINNVTKMQIVNIAKIININNTKIRTKDLNNIK